MTVVTVGVADETLVFDPVSEDPGNSELNLNDGDYSIEEMAFPAPPVDARYAQPADTDGDPLVALRYRNREITLTIGIVAASDTALASANALLVAKIAKLNRYGGTLQRTIPTGTSFVFDVLEADIQLTTDIPYTAGRYVRASIKLVCKPFGRGEETSYTAHSGFPLLVFDEATAPDGDIPALGRLVVTELQSESQRWLVAGMQVANFDTTDPSHQRLYYQAEGLTLLGGATVVGDAGAVGTSAVQYTLTGTPTQILSFQATGGGSYLTHTGSFRVFARVNAPTAASFALDWAQGDILASIWTRNDPVSPETDQWWIVDLGVVRLPEPITGANQWDGRIVASTSGSSTACKIDYVFLVPIDEWSGEIQGTSVNPALYADNIAELRHDGVVRQESTGTYYTAISYEGDLLTVPVAGPEDRGLRCIVKATRVGSSDLIDEIEAQLHVTPRWLVVPG